MIIEIKVMPNSGKNLWKLNKADQLTCYLKSTPERGLANHELITLLSRALKIPKNDIRIVTGQTSRLKRVELSGVTLAYPDLLRTLGIEPQLSLLK
ncbi:MAG: DUF167 domain-containing protein [Candidatus Dependentiae bacterium]|nr:DUF167 domain-containing protein [Candidatus Dependentiae bacterium]